MTDRRRCICWYRIKVKKEPKEEVFKTCRCSKGCGYCYTYNQRCGGMV